MCVLPQLEKPKSMAPSMLVLITIIPQTHPGTSLWEAQRAGLQTCWCQLKTTAEDKFNYMVALIRVLFFIFFFSTNMNILNISPFHSSETQATQTSVDADSEVLLCIIRDSGEKRPA